MLDIALSDGTSCTGERLEPFFKWRQKTYHTPVTIIAASIRDSIKMHLEKLTFNLPILHHLGIQSYSQAPGIS